MAIPTQTPASNQWLHDRERHYLSCLTIRSTLVELDPYQRCRRSGLPADLACQHSPLRHRSTSSRRTVSRLSSNHGWRIGPHVCRYMETISNETRAGHEYHWQWGIVGPCQTSQYSSWHSDPLGRIYYSDCHRAN